MIRCITILLAGLILASCAGTSDPDPLRSKELQWKTGDRKVFFIDDGDTTYTDTTTVTSAAIVDGHYTVTWVEAVSERIREGVFEYSIKYEPDRWRSYGKLPTTLGELHDEEEFTRTAADGTPLGLFIIECRTSSADTTISVPVGTFRCMASRGIFLSLPDRKPVDGYETLYWYAPGIGYIQIEEYMVTLTGGRSTKLLKRTQLASIIPD